MPGKGTAKAKSPFTKATSGQLQVWKDVRKTCKARPLGRAGFFGRDGDCKVFIIDTKRRWQCKLVPVLLAFLRMAREAQGPSQPLWPRSFLARVMLSPCLIRFVWQATSARKRDPFDATAFCMTGVNIST